MAGKIITCEFGFTARGEEDAIVKAAQQHGREAHNMEATREQVLAMAKPAG
jgi:predicted small metal-binding protein